MASRIEHTGSDVLEQAEIARSARGVEPRSAAERDQRVAHVHVDRAHREVQLGRDLAVRAALGDTPDHLQLARRETGGAGGRGLRGAEPGELTLGGGLQRTGAEPAGMQARVGEPLAREIVEPGILRGRGPADEQLRAVVRQLDLAVQLERPPEVLDGSLGSLRSRASSPSARACIARASRLPYSEAIVVSARTTRFTSSSSPHAAKTPADQARPFRL